MNHRYTTTIITAHNRRTEHALHPSSRAAIKAALKYLIRGGLPFAIICKRG